MHARVLFENSLNDNGTVAILLGIIAVLTVLYLFRRRNGPRLPPGPMGLPVFGYYFNMGKNPMKKVDELAKKYGSVVGLYLGPQYVVFLTDWAAMKDAFRQDSSLDRPPSLFANVPYKLGFGGSNGPEWVHTRRLSARAMKDVGLNRAGWEELIQEEAMDLVHRIAKEGETPSDVREMFADSFANNVVTLILGERLHVGHPVTRKLTKWVDAIMEYSPTLGMLNFSPTLSKLLQVLGVEKQNLLFEKVDDFGKFVSKTVDEKIRNPIADYENSFLGRFQAEIQSRDRESKTSYLTEDSMKGSVLALLTGGSETTRTSIIWTLIDMADHPDIQSKVQEELDAVIGREGSIRWEDRFKVPYTYATLLESMRVGTTGPFTGVRMASQDMKILGYHIPKGTFITASTWSVNHDPRYWENPEQFAPERFLQDDGKKVNTSPEGYSVFSYGKRNCPGKLLAHMVGLHYFVAILQKFKVTPRQGAKVKYDTLLGLTYQATNVQLRFTPR